MRLFVLTCLAFLSPFVTARTDELEATERRLRTFYQGKLARLQSLPDQGNIQVILWNNAPSIDSDVPIFLFVEKVNLKERKLELRVRRVYFYQTLKGKIQGLKGEEKKVQLKWREKEEKIPFLQILKQVLPIVMDKPEEWPGYWPPSRPSSTTVENVREKPSTEIAPGVFTIGSDITWPRCEHCPDPILPRRLRARRVQGTVVLETIISAKGRVGGLRLVKSAGNEVLDQSAVMAVSKWRWKPATLNGKPVRVFLTVNINFQVY